MRLKDLTKYQQGGKTIWNKLNSEQRRDYIYSAFLQKGYTPVQAAAIVGNLQQENRSFGTTTKNPKSQATGIAQWLGSRKKALQSDYEDWYDIDNQIDFIHREIKGDRSAWTNNVGGKNAFLNATDVDTATTIFRKDFERPGEHEANDKARITTARSLLGMSGSTSTYASNNNTNYYSKPEEYIGWQQPQGSVPTDIRQFDFASLPKETQETVQENQRLQQEKLNQELMADKIQQENLAIEQELKNKALEREQILSSLPQAEFVGSNLKRNPYNELLQGSNSIT